MASLTVIVPVYNVERYLDECLHSLRVQTWTDLEVVMVDDGSEDGSAAIAARYVEQDPRFRLVQQENAGLGAARNTGVLHARGDFLTFVDSDDVIPPYAFGYHMASLARSGSDFSSGNVHLLTELSVRQSPMHREIFRQTRRKTHVSRDRILLVDRLATNKVWRRSFWDEQGLSFPVGVLYEDEAVVIPLHFLAKSVDVLSQPVYLWRQRPSDDKSITQDRFRPNALEDRFTAVTAVGDFVSENMRPQDKRDWDAVALGQDLRAFVQVLDEADDDFVARFLKLSAVYLEGVDGRVLRDLPAMERLKWYLIREGRGQELQQAVAFSKSVHFRRAKVVRHGVRFYGDYIFKDDPVAAVPRSVYRIGKELSPLQKAESVTWSEGKLVLRGRALLKFFRPNRKLQQRIRACAVNTDTGKRHRLPVSVHMANEFRLPPEAATSRRDWGGYEITVDPKALARAGHDSTWWIELAITNRGFRRTTRLAFPEGSPVRRVGAAEVGPGILVRPEWEDGQAFLIRVEHGPARVTGYEFDGDSLLVTGELAGDPDGARLLLSRAPGDTEISVPLTLEEGSFRGCVDLSQFTAGHTDRVTVPGALRMEEWWFRIGTSDGAKTLVGDTALSAEHSCTDGTAVRIGADHTGAVRVQVEREPAIVTSLEWEAGALVLSGRYHGRAEGASFLLSAEGRVDEQPFPVELSEGAFRTKISPAELSAFGQSLPLAPGTYRFLLRREGDSAGLGDSPVRVGTELASRLPEEMPGEAPDITIDTDPEGCLLLRADEFLRPEEKGSYAQQLLRERTYPSLRKQPLVPGVLFSSYSGKQYSDSPRGMYEELRRRNASMPLSWLVKDRQVVLPEGLSRVDVKSRDYFEALARTEYVVSNSHLPVWFAKRDGQKVVQTWHGSMLKRIGFDIEDVHFGNRDYHERLAKETGQWDYLISPSPWATPILRSAFRYEGEILETGYPRNDIFHAPNRDALADRVRARLGLPEGKKVLLYAPTWRDDKFYSPGKYKLDLRLDIQRLYDALGDEYVLMVRRHPNIVDRVPVIGEDFVFEVSAYPEIQELFLVTDVLVTDYSSLMFDYANTGRPMLFFTYDLEDYRDKLRGFYFDFEETAPGPLLRSSDEIIESIRGIEEVHASYKTRYEAFVDQFCPLDDGKAAARVVEQVFGELL
ncbi:bifunctional glycosyltransferase/CDP-glycerol:glycerophosphate glycerophosphotransferase [Nocardiopsis algeriensis]|uniref:bifunctional glycosyltransferase/CDP-glycerol:glycerophosphate glycerophosphotransferase n=1 Tax=Nocardiopsis algeriensis TaxID=1478215 RepID=UPI003B42AEA9